MTDTVRGRRPRWLIFTVSAVAAVLVMIGTAGVLTVLSRSLPGAHVDLGGDMLFGPRADGLVDMDGNRVVPESGVMPGSDTLDAMEPTGPGGARFVVPTVGLDVPLGEMSSVNGIVEPPTFTMVYRIRNMGVPVAEADEGTVFVVTHSLRNGIAPGNFLIDADNAAATIPAGADIVVDGVTYRTEKSVTVAKSEIAGRAEVWADRPDRLVIITCLQRPDMKPSTNNLVIIADRIQE